MKRRLLVLVPAVALLGGISLAPASASPLPPPGRSYWVNQDDASILALRRDGRRIRVASSNGSEGWCFQGFASRGTYNGVRHGYDADTDLSVAFDRSGRVMTETDYNYDGTSSISQLDRVSTKQANTFLRSMNPYANTTQQVYRKCASSGW